MSKLVTRDELINLEFNHEKEMKNIEDTHKKRIKIIENVYYGKQLILSKKLNEENQNYYNKKLEYERQKKINTEHIQKKLLDEVKKQYKKEQEKIFKEYKEFESEAHKKYTNKQYDNIKTYKDEFEKLVTKYSKLIKSQFKIKNDIDQNINDLLNIDIPYIDKILKNIKTSNCNEFDKLNLEYNTYKKKLSNEYKKTRENWQKNNQDMIVDIQDESIDKQIMGNLKNLESEYLERLSRLKYKQDINKFVHLNFCNAGCKILDGAFIYMTKCKKCKPQQNIELCEYCKKASPFTHQCNTIAKLGKEFQLGVSRIFFDYYLYEMKLIQYHETVIPKEQNLVYTILYAEKIWTKIKSRVILDIDYAKKTDDEKVDEFSKSEEKFYKDFPIVAKYMILNHNYNRKAFKKYLNKMILNNESNAIKADKSKPGESREKWIELQTDYVSFLYQEHHGKKHIPFSEIKNIKAQTRKLLKKDFDDFEKMYDKKKKELEDGNKKDTAIVANNLVKRLTSIQSIEQKDEYKLLIEVENTLFMQNSRKNLKELATKVKLVNPLYEGKGLNQSEIELWDKDKKINESKEKFNNTKKIKNLLKYHYDNINLEEEQLFMVELKNLVYVQQYREVLLEFRKYKKVIGESYCGNGTNDKLEIKWQKERDEWQKERGDEIKIHIPYNYNLLKLYYDNR